MPRARLNAATLAQLPRTAAEYLLRVETDPVFHRVHLGDDDVGRRVYQAFLDGEPYGAPRAMLTYAEYRRDVRTAAALPVSGGVGVSRWTEPYWRDLAPSPEWTARAEEALRDHAGAAWDALNARLLRQAIG